MQLTRPVIISAFLFLVACGDSGPGEQAQAVSGQAARPEPEPCTLTMGYDPWEPYQYEIAGGNVFGLDVDLLTLVSRQAGCDITFERGTWRELLQQIRDGEIDLLAGATKTAEREEFAWFTQPYRNEEFIFYVSANRFPDFRDKTLAALLDEGIRIGVVDSYLYGDRVSALQDDPRYSEQFEYASIAELNVERLLDGVIDGFIEDKYVGASIIRHKSLQEFITPHPMHFGSTGVSIMVSRASVDPALFEALDRSVGQLKDSGAIDKVLAQYQNP